MRNAAPLIVGLVTGGISGALDFSWPATIALGVLCGLACAVAMIAYTRMTRPASGG